MSVLSRLAHDWAVRSFGSDHVVNGGIRALRTAEEAIELAQAFDVPKETVLKCVEMVYAKPKGEPLQELGGVYVTAGILAESLGVEADAVFEVELRRVLQKPPKHWGDRNQAKLDVGMSVESPIIPGGPGNLGAVDVSTRFADKTCTRDHLCGSPVGGPCNGFKRPPNQLPPRAAEPDLR